MIFEKPQLYRQVGGSLNCFNKSFVTLFGQAGWPDALGRVSATTGWGGGGGGARVVVVGRGGGGLLVLGLGLPGHLAEPLHCRHVAADGVVAGAGVPARRVVEPVLDGGVLDHDAAVVLGQGRVRQLRDGRRGGGALGPQQNRVLGHPALDREAAAAPAHWSAPLT